MQGCLAGLSEAAAHRQMPVVSSCGGKGIGAFLTGVPVSGFIR